jgi:cytochrome c oxidase subunit 3
MVAHQFEDAAQQRESSTLGMWVFLATEIMFFGGLFAAYTAYRYTYPIGFAEASHHLDVWLGGINTAVLLTSSLTMALAVRSAQIGKRRQIVGFLVLTMLLGLAFLGIKAYEYHAKFVHHLVPGASFEFEGTHAREAQMFFYLYFAMTGLHAIHMFAGVAVVLVITGMAARGKFTPGYYNPLEVTGLYWHFVDIIWIFLYPLLYLIA